MNDVIEYYDVCLCSEYPFIGDQIADEEINYPGYERQKAIFVDGNNISDVTFPAVEGNQNDEYFVVCAAVLGRDDIVISIVDAGTAVVSTNQD